MKRFIWVLLAVVLVGVILYSNIQQQKAQDSGKKNVYLVLPLTGPFTEYTNSIRKVVSIWKNKHPNSNFQILYKDSEGNPTKTISMINQVSTEDKKPLFITSMSLINSAILPVVKRINGFNFAITTQITKPEFNDTHFQKMSHSLEDELLPILKLIKHSKRIAIFYTHEEFGFNCSKFIESNLEKEQILSNIPIAMSSIDNKIEVLKVLEQKPDKILILGLPVMGTENIIRNLHTNNFTGDIIVSSSFIHRYIIQNIGKDMDGIIIPSLDLKNINKSLLMDLTQNNIDVNFSTIELYDLLDLIQYTLDNNLPFTQETYTKMGKWDGVAGEVKFTGNGDSLYPFVLVKYQNGEFIPVESEDK